MHLDELRGLLDRHARADGTTAIDDVLISKDEHPGAPSASMSGTILAVIAQGAKRLALGDRVYEYRAGQYLVASVDLPVTGHFTEASPQRPALGFGLVLRPEAVAAPGSRRPASPSAPRPTTCSTPSSGWCGCSTGRATSPCSRRCTPARSSGG